jgi:eukaryotic-like serine/threonine-protein kinase
MVTNGSISAEREERLNEVLAAYLEAVEAGHTVDRQEWLERYPDLAGELAEFFANRDQVLPPADAMSAETAVFAEGATPPAPRGDDAHPTYGDYQILDEIARGGMGVVYKARHVSLKRVVALKMILTDKLAGAGAVRRFRTEAEAAASLDHPNIVPIYEVGERDGNPYFTMKLIEGGSLANWIADRRLQVADYSQATARAVARLLATVARAVHHAHQRGILHRDLKPANILLQPADDQHSAICNLQSAIPLVTDFGLAKRVRADGWASQSCTIVGTAYYMAPEQAQPKDGALTLAADVYSLGAVLYEMLTGRPPFRGEGYLDTLYQVVHHEPPPLRQLNPRLDADLERICLKCLAKMPEARYASAAALADDLESWAADGPVSVRPPGRGERVWRWCRRNPLPALLLTAVAGLLIVGAVYSSVMNVLLSATADRAETNAAKAAQHATEAEAARVVADRARDQALTALQREQLALREEQVQRAKSRELLMRQYVSNGAGLLDRGDPVGALAWFGEALHLEQGDPVREAPHRIRLAAALRHCPRMIQVAFLDGGVRTFCLNPDGRRLFTAGREGPARLWDTVADRAVPLRLADGDRVIYAVFSPDSRLLATADAGDHVRLWEAAGGDSIGRPMHQSGGVALVAFASDSKHLLTAGRDGTARVWPTTAGKPASPVLQHGAELTFAAFSPDGRLVVTTGLAAGSGRPEACVWDWATGKQVTRPLRHVYGVSRAAFSAYGRRLFTAANNHNLRIWDLATGKPIPVPLPNPRGSNGPWFSPDGQRVLLAQETSARVFELSTGHPVGAPLPHGGDVVLGAFSHDGRQLVTAGWDRAVRVWDTLSGQPLTPPLRHPRRVLGAAFDRSGRLLVTGCDDGTVRLWDLCSRDQAGPALHVKSAVSVPAVAPGGRSALALSNGVWRVWEVAGGAPVTSPLPVVKVTHAAFSPDGKRFATVDPKGLRLWDVTAKAQPGRTLEPATKVQQITFSPDGSRMAARLAGDEVRIWDAATGAAVAAGKQPGSPPWEVPVLSPDGRRVVTLKFRRFVQVCDLATGKLVLRPFKHTAAVLHAAYSPDGRRLATASADGTVHIWDAALGEPLTPPLAHGQFLHLVGFSLDGRQLATAGSDGTARVWDAWTGLPLTPLLHQAEPVTTATFSPEGDRLATVSKGGTVRIWDLRPDGRPAADLLQLARLLSGQQMHAASGSFLPFDLGDLRQSWPQLRARFPVEFGKE